LEVFTGSILDAAAEALNEPGRRSYTSTLSGRYILSSAREKIARSVFHEI
jgi:hypothetical protein